MVRTSDASDTPAHVERELLSRYAAMSLRDKLKQVMDLSLAVRQLAAARIRRQYGPDLSDRELRLRLAALSMDRELLIAAFG